MKKRLIIFSMLGFILLADANISFAQWVSPGELSNAHEKLEGIANCFKCHAVTMALNESACRSCHKGLEKRLKDDAGFHAKIQRKCVNCHTEHEGKEVNISRLDKETFDHDLTGYRLLDRHSISCDKCHKKVNTYFELSPECTGCHNDTHKRTMTEECLKCHDYKSWKDLVFDHDINTEYKLKGKHTDLKCESCHSPALSEATGDDKAVFATLKFKPLKHEKCSDCHYDLHNGEVKKRPCAVCHMTDGWKANSFNHNDPLLSDYKLSGRHNKVACALCHPERIKVFRKGGKIIEVNTYKLMPVKHSSCSNCHYDVHLGQFEKRDCNTCHSVSNEWKDHSFKHESPDYSGYKLTGKHKNVSCDNCHERSSVKYSEFNNKKNKSLGRFRPVKNRECIDCHFDIHTGEFDKQKCDACHSLNKTWKAYTFSHEPEKEGGYRLEGKHVGVVCEKCHERTEIIYTEFRLEKKRLMSKFRPLKSKGDCTDCHKDEHKERFKGINEVTEITCDVCHSVENEWKEFGYKHISEIKFKKYQLNFKAGESECEKCHTCGSEVFCTYCCIRRCMPCDFKQKILRSKDTDLYQIKDQEP